MKPLVLIVLTFVSYGEAQCHQPESETFVRWSGMTPEQATPVFMYSASGDEESLTGACLSRCRELPDCAAVIVVYTQGNCQGVSSSRLTRLRPDNNVAYFNKVCLKLPDNCKHRWWSVESTPGYFLNSDGADVKVLLNTTMQDCYEAMFSTNEKRYRSAQWIEPTNQLDNYFISRAEAGSCVLNGENKFTEPESYRVSNSYTFYIENQCGHDYPKKIDRCSYEEYYNQTIKHVDLTANNYTKDECKSACENENRFVCRGFTWKASKSRGLCDLHSEDLVTTGSWLLRRVSGAKYYRRVICLNISVECSASHLMVSYKPRGVFRGRVYVAGRGERCGTRALTPAAPVKLALPLHGDCDVNFAFAISKGPNGIINRTMAYAMLMIQNNPIIQTAGDRWVRVGCSPGEGAKGYTKVDATVAVQDPGRPSAASEWSSSVDRLGASAVFGYAAPLVMYVTTLSDDDSTVVALGDMLELRIDTSADAEIEAYHLVASSRLGDSSVLLLDSRGCPTGQVDFPSFSRSHLHGIQRLSSQFKAFRFPSSHVVRFSVMVRFCEDKCPPTNCRSMEQLRNIRDANDTYTATDQEVAATITEQNTMPNKRKLKKRRSRLPYKKKYTTTQLELALEEMQNKSISSYEAEKKFGIPRRTLLDKINKKHPKNHGGPTRLSEVEEDRIVKVMIAAAEYGSPLTTLDLRIVVGKYVEANGKKEIFNNELPGRKWVMGFLKRNKSKISIRVAQNIKRSRAEKSPEEMAEYFKNLEVSLNVVDKDNILNYDETNVTDNPGAEKCIFRRGVKYPERVINFTKGAISIMFAITASGECLPPYVVYKAEHLYDQWRINGPPGTRYNRSKSGWFDSTIFEDWFMTIILPCAKKKTGIKVLIGDNLASHMNHKIVELCEANDIRFVFLPPNSSHITQPLDVCYFGPLKRLWRNVLLRYKISNPREATINKSHFPELLKQLMIQLNEKTSNIRSAFRSTGIYPLNSYEVIKRLPNAKLPSDYSIDQALLDYLKENRAPNPMRKVRNKKLNAIPGKSVSSEDFLENVKVPKKKKKEVKNCRKILTKTISPLIRSNTEVPTLSAICLKTITTLLEKDKVKKPEKKKLIILEDVILPPEKKYTMEFQKSTDVVNVTKNISHTIEIKMKSKHDKEKLEKNLNTTLASTSNISKKKSVKITKKNKKTKKKAMKEIDSDSNSSDNISNISLGSDTESWNEFCTVIKDEAEELNEQEASLDQDIDNNIPISQDIAIGSYVLVKFPTKKTITYYVGLVIHLCPIAGWKIRFLRKNRNSFVWPHVNDESYVLEEDICTVLPTPIDCRRGRLTFKFDFKNYKVL